MLQAIRGQASSWIVKVLFGLLIITFGFWGVDSWLKSAATPTTVAEVGPVRIEPPQFSQAVQLEMQRFRQILGGNFDRDQARQFGIGDRVIEQLVARTLLQLEARRVGVVISDAAVRDAIRDNPTFKDERGQFDRNRFAMVINRAGYSEAGFLEELRRDLERTQLVRPLVDGAEPPKALVDAVLRYRGERRIAETFVIAPAAVGATPAPTDALLEEYLKTNSARFMRPEYRTLSYVMLTPSALEGRITISDADVKEAYTARLDEFTVPELRTVAQLLLPDQAAADQASQQLAAGTDFDAVAKALGKSVDALGTVKRADLPDEFAAPVFELAANGVTKPVKSSFGWHIFKVTEIKPGSVEPFEAVKDRLGAELKHEKAADEVPQLANRLEDSLAGGLDEAAQKVDLPVAKTPPVDQRGLGADGKPVPGLPPAPPQQQAGSALLAPAFGLGAGQTSRLVELSDDSYLAVRVDEITPAVLPPLADIKPAVTASWTQAERDKAAKARADALLEKLKAGTEMEAAAREVGAALKTSSPFTRDGAGAQLPTSLVTTLFGGAVGTAGVAATPDGYVVARLKAIEPLDPATADAQRTKLAEELRQAVGSDLLQQFEAGLREHFAVSINRRAVDQAF